jgi:polar amino acid transport system substrate-binding protein
MRVLCFILFLLTCSGSLTADSQDLIVGMELSYPPFETIDADGTPAGISVDLAKALGDYLDRRVVIKNIPFIGLIPSLKTGKIDLIISSLSITSQRKEAIDFSDPYLKIGLALLVSKKSDLQSIEDANQKGRVIVVKQGTTGEVYARTHLTKATVLTLDKEAACVLEVAQGKADAFIYDQFSIYNNWQKNLNTTRAILTPFEIEHWAIGVKKGNRLLLDQVNAFLKQFRLDRGFDDLAERYLKDQREAFKNFGIPFYF